MASAFAFVSALRRGRRAGVVEELELAWSAFDRLSAHDGQIKGSLVSDANLAAVAISHKARVATRDRGFSCFAGLSSSGFGAETN